MEDERDYTDAGPLFCEGDLEYANSRAPWLAKIMEKKKPFPGKKRWPGGAWSASRIKLLGWCPYRHYLKYEESKKDPPGPAAQVGKVVHGALEYAGYLRLRDGSIPWVASVEELQFLACRAAADLKGDKSEGMSCSLSELLERSREILEGLGPVDYRGLYEVEALFTWRPPGFVGFKIGGYIDAILHSGGSADRPRQVIVRDYKTGMGEIPSEEECFRDPQIAAYLCWAHERWPHSFVVFDMWYVAKGPNARIYVPWSKKLQNTFLDTVDAARVAQMHYKNRATPGDHCGHCPFRGTCGAFSQRLQKGLVDLPKESMREIPMDRRMTLHCQARLLEKIAKTRKEDLARSIIEDLGQKQMRYESRTHKVSKTRRSKRYFESERIMLEEMAAIGGVEVLDLMESLTRGMSTQKLDAWIKGLAEEKREKALELLERKSSKGYGKWSIRVTEKKGASPF